MKTRRISRKYLALALTLVLCSCTQPVKMEEESLADSAASSNLSSQKGIAAGRVTQLPSDKLKALAEPAKEAVMYRAEAPSPQFSAVHPQFAVQAGGSGLEERKKLPHVVNPIPQTSFNTESYDNITENRFILTRNDSLSTFSIDVDTASYANLRRMLNRNQLPPPGSIRIEEMINYFSYDYPADRNKDIRISTEIGPSPWRKDGKLVRIGIAAKDIDGEQLPAANFVFLIDVSGSMGQPNKLPLLQQSMHLLIDSMGDNDRLSIVVYAGADRIVLEPTPGSQKDILHKAVDNLTAGGSTHASSGIRTAYELAQKHFIKGGNNRVILASDGDFNVGITSRDELEKLIAGKKESGVYLTVLGFGMGNYHDDTMEVLADKGNGNYAYIDSLLEANKVLVKERVANLFTLASDVKLQIEFNPATVGGYRLLGYENRLLADEDFKDDKKDAGEIGVGHRVTAIYELLPPDSKELPEVEPLKYQQMLSASTDAELMTVKLRYKPADGTDVVQIAHNVVDRDVTLAKTSNDFRFAAAVAGFGMILRDSAYSGSLTLADVKNLAAGSRGPDREGYRSEFVRLVETAMLLKAYDK